MRPIVILLSFFSCLYSPLLFAASQNDSFKKSYWAIELGAFEDNLQKRHEFSNGHLTSTLTGYVRFRRAFHLGRSWHLESSLGTALPWRSGNDGSVKVFTSHFMFDLAHPIFSFLRFRLGTGIQWEWLRSSAVTVQLNNGTGLSSFYLPGRNVSTWTLIVHSALEIWLSQRWFLSGGVYGLQIGSDSRRDFSALASLGVRL